MITILLCISLLFSICTKSLEPEEKNVNLNLNYESLSNEYQQNIQIYLSLLHDKYYCFDVFQRFIINELIKRRTNKIANLDIQIREFDKLNKSKLNKKDLHIFKLLIKNLNMEVNPLKK